MTGPFFPQTWDLKNRLSVEALMVSAWVLFDSLAQSDPFSVVLYSCLHLHVWSLDRELDNGGKILFHSLPLLLKGSPSHGPYSVDFIVFSVIVTLSRRPSLIPLGHAPTASFILLHDACNYGFNFYLSSKHHKLLKSKSSICYSFIPGTW